MSQQSTKNKSNSLNVPEPTLRTLTVQVSPRKWYGCIYLSSYDLTGQIIQLLMDFTGEYNGKFLNQPIFILKSTKKAGVEIKLNEKIKTLIKAN